MIARREEGTIRDVDVKLLPYLDRIMDEVSVSKFYDEKVTILKKLIWKLIGIDVSLASASPDIGSVFSPFLPTARAEC